MATEDSLKQDNEQFGAAFDEPGTPKVEQTEDEAFGLNLPATDGATEGDGETDGGEVVTAGAETPEADAVAAEPEAPAAATEAAPAVAEEPAPAEGGEAAPAAADPAESTEGETAQEQAQETPAEESAEGEFSPEEAMARLTEDFGPEFVKMICAIAGKSAADVAGKQVAEVRNTLKDLIDNIRDSRAQRHFKAIYAAHPDFKDVAESEAFKSWVAAMEPEKKADAERVIIAGDSDEINDLLSQFKASSQTDAGGADDEEVDGAEGVRSTGLRLPDAPEAGADDFGAAWDEFK